MKSMRAVMAVATTVAVVITVAANAAGKFEPTYKSLASHELPAWFDDAKLGIFVHWGIYAVNGVDESWSFYNKKISHADYMKQMSGFTASGYNPEAWADLIAESGARYAVITTKHHDGVALWPTKQAHYSVFFTTL